MPRIPTPLTWKRRPFAVLEPMGMVDRLHAVAVSGLISGPFAIYHSPSGSGFSLIHLPTQARIIGLETQNLTRHAAEEFAACNVNWWTCLREEVIGPDLQEMRNIYARLKPASWIANDWRKGEDQG